jgi:integral membrane protein (TIGR01906 family)
MNARSRYNYLVGLLISVLLFPALLVASIQVTTYDKKFYWTQYERLDTANTIGISQDDLNRVTGELLDYIKGTRPSMNGIKAEINGEVREVFNDREKAHMVDVRDLFFLASKVRNVSIAGIFLLSILLYSTAGKQSFRFFAASYLAAAAGLLVLLAVLVPVIQSNFTYYWDQFHYLFFDNDLWILNPETDIMIQMVPEPFFNSAVLRVIAFFAGGSALIGILCAWALLAAKKQGKLIRNSR